MNSCDRMVSTGWVDGNDDEMTLHEFECSVDEEALAAFDAAALPDLSGVCGAKGFFRRVDELDDEWGWQPTEAWEQWLVVSDGQFDLSNSFEVVVPSGWRRVACDGLPRLPEAIEAASAEGGVFARMKDVPGECAPWRASRGWVGVRPLWGEGPYGEAPVGGRRPSTRELMAPWIAAKRPMRCADGARQLVAVGFARKGLAGRISALAAYQASRRKPSDALVSTGRRGWLVYRPR